MTTKKMIPLKEFHEIPKHLQNNIYVRRFYRPQTDWLESVFSLAYLHNETVNVISHGEESFLCLLLIIIFILYMTGLKWKLFDERKYQFFFQLSRSSLLWHHVGLCWTGLPSLYPTYPISTCFAAWVLGSGPWYTTRSWTTTAGPVFTINSLLLTFVEFGFLRLWVSGRQFLSIKSCMKYEKRVGI